MVATVLSGFGTTYQRIILQEIQDPANRFFPVFGLESVLLFSLSNRDYVIEFTGQNLNVTATGPVGSVTGIKARLITDGVSADIFDITDLNIPDFGGFVTDALGLPLGEPDFSNPDVADYYDIVTPGVINGSKEKDFLETGVDRTDVDAGAGNDVLIAGPGGGSYNMGGGKKDAVDFRLLTDPLILDMEAGTATAGGGTYAISGVNIIFGTNLADTLNGSSDADRIFGRDGADKINGLSGDDHLFGDFGDDVIRGGSGNDRLWGQADNDMLFGNNGNDRLSGGAGEDDLFGGAGNDRLWGDSGADLLFGGAGDDTIFGGSGRDILRGNDGADTLFGQGGNDRLIGGAGNDLLKGGSGSDSLFGLKGTDTLEGGSGEDFLKGGAGNDILTGGSDDDTLRGGSGADIIEGGTGDDDLNGGVGDDVFVFDGTLLGDDTITDFTPGEDLIQIFGQDVADVSIVREFVGNFLITHAEGTIEVEDVSDSFTFADIDESTFF